jgi:hypothetical protein
MTNQEYMEKYPINTVMEEEEDKWLLIIPRYQVMTFGTYIFLYDPAAK